MSTENENTAVEETAALTDAEKAYFESGGESPIEAEPEPAPEPEPQAQAEPQGDQAEPAPQANQQEETSRNVPYHALREERERRKALEQQLHQMNGRWQTVEQRLAALQGLNQTQQKEPEAPKIPDPEEDFIEATRWTQQQIMEMQRRQQEQMTNAQRAQQAQQFQGQVMNAWSQRARQAAQQSPEFADAYRFATTSRFRELIASGVPEAQARNQARREEFNFVAQSMQSGRDPAKALIGIAQARGWQPKAREQAAPQQNTPAQPQRLDTVARGQAANKSLSSVGSSATGRGNLDAKQLAEMSDDDFAAFLNKKGSNGFKAMLGG